MRPAQILPMGWRSGSSCSGIRSRLPIYRGLLSRVTTCAIATWQETIGHATDSTRSSSPSSVPSPVPFSEPQDLPVIVHSGSATWKQAMWSSGMSIERSLGGDRVASSSSESLDPNAIVQLGSATWKQGKRSPGGMKSKESRSNDYDQGVVVEQLPRGRNRLVAWPMAPSFSGTFFTRGVATRHSKMEAEENFKGETTGDDLPGIDSRAMWDVPEMTPGTRALAEGVLSGRQIDLSRAITLCESSRKDHKAQGTALLQYLTQTSKAARSRSMFRIGVSGPPGAGKSSLIERLGMCAVKGGHKVAVLAVDPSSEVSGGSILGDKTRMEQLASHPNAFVRPSPSRGLVGGIALNTADAAALCEAAGFSMLMVETVGGGQSDTAVAELVDMLLLVLPPAGGDELQGLKKGIVEVADLLVVNKADGETAKVAAATVREYKNALHFLRPSSQTWTPPVIACSVRTRDGIEDVLKSSLEFERKMKESGELDKRRAHQNKKLMWRNVRHMITDRLLGDEYLRTIAADLGDQVKNGMLVPRAAATTITQSFFRRISDL